MKTLELSTYNLENLGVKEFSVEELNEIDGGFLHIGIVVAIWGIQVAACTALMAIYASVLQAPQPCQPCR
jgi:lactobin A/cerein 7B family class IIb bacteriocin